MASISGATSGNTISSLYNSANVISGLASGLDTEGMIENLVKSYQAKIDSLNQQATKTEWKQEAYRSIISKMVGFTNKYTSYNSPATNLLSRGFFTNAVKVATQGVYKDKVSASGKTSSDISLNAVHQLATAAQYRVGDSRLNSGDGKSIQSASDIDLLGKTTLGSLQGSLTISYGSNKVNISFDEVADKKAIEEIKNSGKTGAEALAELINRKLEGQKITFSNGKTENAEDRIKVTVTDGTIAFSDKSTAGNAVYMSAASGNVEEVLGLDLEDAAKKQPGSFKLNYDFSLTKDVDNTEYLSGKAMNLNLNGSTKTIYLPKITKEAQKDADGNEIKDADGNVKYDYFIQDGDNKVKITDTNKSDVNRIYTEQVSAAVKSAFKDKIEVSNVGTGGELKLNFKVKEDGSDLKITSDVGEALGIGQTATTYLNTSKTLEDLVDLSKLDSVGKDDKGNDLYAFEINGVTVGKYTKDAELSDILNDINSSKDAGVKVSYSQTTKEFLFSAKETGADSEIKMGDGLAAAMFGVDTTQKTKDYLKLDSLKDQNVVLTVKDKDGNDVEAVNFTFKRDDSTLDGMLKQFNKQLDKNNLGLKASISGTGALILTDSQGKRVDYTASGEVGTKLQNKVAEAGYSKGQDAEFTATVNGKQMKMTRSSNSVSIDGLTINMKETFDSSAKKDKDGNPMLDDAGNVIKNLDKNGKPVYSADDSVTFKSTTDSDKIVDAVKAMIEDYNAMLSEIRGAYSTLPAQKTDGSSYEPLTSDQASKYSESEQKKYEEKAKQGILFADRDLSTLYNKLQSVFSPSGQDGAILRGIGVSTSYDVGIGALTITLDEDKLRSMLDSDPDMVADAFTRTSGNGGVMQNLKSTLDTYAKTSGEPKGILIQKAGSPLSPLSLMNNTWQKQIDNYNKQIEKWQDKLSSQVDRYTQQFSRLEQLIAQMNSQSSALAGLMGGG